MEFLKDLLEAQYGTKIAEAILRGFSAQRAVTLRANLLKCSPSEMARDLQNANIEFDKVPWCNEAFILKNAQESELREFDIYEEGKCYLQSLSSMLPPIVLAPNAGEDILDMAAAPGGKTTQMISMTRGKAHITACERNKIRAEKLKYNLQKQGAGAVSVLIQDARQLDDFMSFDKILLDAPCSGSGTLNISDEKKMSKFTIDFVNKSSSLQFSLLKKAVKLLKRDGELVYSTCSILQSENEENVAKILDKGMEIVPIEFEGMEEFPLLPCKIDGALCVKPTEFYEGFFVCKMVKR